MQTPIINIVLMAVVAVISVTVIVYWHAATRGTWKRWPAGRSLMGLLGIIGVAFSYGVTNALIGPEGYPAKQYISFGLYGCFAVALVIIGLTIRLEIGRGREVRPDTGTIDITVAETEKEPS